MHFLFGSDSGALAIAITGFPPGTVAGATHAGDARAAQAAQAQSDLVIASTLTLGSASHVDLINGAKRFTA